ATPRLRDRVSPAPTVPGHRSSSSGGADGDGHDDAAPAHDLAADEDHLLCARRRLGSRCGIAGAKLHGLSQVSAKSQPLFRLITACAIVRNSQPMPPGWKTAAVRKTVFPLPPASSSALRRS